MSTQIQEKILRFINSQGKAVDYEILKKRFKYFHLPIELQALKGQGYIKIKRPLPYLGGVKLIYLTHEGINHLRVIG